MDALPQGLIEKVQAVADIGNEHGGVATPVNLSSSDDEAGPSIKASGKRGSRSAKTAYKRTLQISDY